MIEVDHQATSKMIRHFGSCLTKLSVVKNLSRYVILLLAGNFDLPFWKLPDETGGSKEFVSVSDFAFG